MYNTKSKIIIVMIAVIMLMATGYAFYATNLNITTTGSISSSWNVAFTSMSEGDANGTKATSASRSYTATSATMVTNLKEPGDEMTYELTLTNLGDIKAVIEDIHAEATGSSAIVFSIDGIKKGEVLAKDEYRVIKVKVEFDPATTSQPSETSKTLTVSIRATQLVDQDTSNPTNPSIEQPLYLSTAILKNNVAKSDVGIDFSKTSEETGTNGLYYTNVNTENNGITYYFRGDVENNYVKFGRETRNICTYNENKVSHINNGTFTTNMTEEECLSTNVCSLEGSYAVGLDSTDCSSFGGTMLNDKATFTKNGETSDILWRIVRINENGSVRLIYSGIYTGSNVLLSTGYSNIGRSAFNTQTNDNAYVGYMYGTPGSNNYEGTHKNENDSTIKSYLDAWYEDNLKDNYANYLVDAGFCNDRSVATKAGLWSSFDTALGYSKNYTAYGAAGRLANTSNWTAKENAQPQFACPNEERDLFTTSTSSKGNNKLTNPIGLITMDEVAYAGAILNESNESMYLSGSYIWTMTPFSFYGSNPRIWFVDDDCNAHDNGGVTRELGVRPVISLKANVEIVSGNGTSTNPYVVKTN